MNDPLPNPFSDPLPSPLSFFSPRPALDPERATRGRFLARWNARVIEQDDLIVVEFVDQPWYTEGVRQRHRHNATWCAVLRALHLI